MSSTLIVPDHSIFEGLGDLPDFSSKHESPSIFDVFGFQDPEAVLVPVARSIDQSMCILQQSALASPCLPPSATVLTSPTSFKVSTPALTRSTYHRAAKKVGDYSNMLKNVRTKAKVERKKQSQRKLYTDEDGRVFFWRSVRNKVYNIKWIKCFVEAN